MELSYRCAKMEDAQLLISIYNAAFYDDYIKYGECPAYGRSKSRMKTSIENYPKLIILLNNCPVGVISVENKGNGIYYLGCLCILPEYQGQGIGTKAVKHILSIYSDWKQFELITPIDKEKNIKFYTERCGFFADRTEMDGNVKVAYLVKVRI